MGFSKWCSKCTYERRVKTPKKRHAMWPFRPYKPVRTRTTRPQVCQGFVRTAIHACAHTLGGSVAQNQTLQELEGGRKWKPRR